MKPRLGAQHGGTAIEYLIVTTFAMILAIGSITLVGKAMKEKLAELESRLGIELNADFLDVFD